MLSSTQAQLKTHVGYVSGQWPRITDTFIVILVRTVVTLNVGESHLLTTVGCQQQTPAGYVHAACYRNCHSTVMMLLILKRAMNKACHRT